MVRFGALLVLVRGAHPTKLLLLVLVRGALLKLLLLKMINFGRLIQDLCPVPTRNNFYRFSDYYKLTIDDKMIAAKIPGL